MLSVPAFTSDMQYVKQCTWTFHRDDEQLVLQRQESEDGVALVMITNGEVSTIPFQDPTALATFQRDMEEMLVHTGWSLQQFEPERRRRDRRTFPRVDNDRRRWWTDPVTEEPPSATAPRSKSRTRR